MKQLLFCLSMLVAGLASLGCQQTTAPIASAREIGTVDLVVNFEDGREVIEKAIPCSVGSTVFTTLQRADQHGDLELNAAGSGETAFVKGINGLTGNQETGQYWFFYVNDQMAKQGCGVVEVDPGDLIEWRYQEQPANFDQ